MARPRLLCLFVPDFAAIRLSGEEGRPMAVHRGEGIVALDPLARRLGLRRDMTVSQARAHLSDLSLHEENPDEDRRLWESFLEDAGALSPVIESPEPGLAYADLRGLDALFGGEGGAVARFGELLDRFGWPRRMACAGTRFAAFVAARNLERDGCRAIPPGRDATFLATLPCEILPWKDEDLDCLRDLGLHSLGDLARMEEEAFVRRFGPSSRSFFAMARGSSLGPLRPYPLPRRFEERVQLKGRILEGDALLFRLQGALELLVQALAVRGLACLALRLHVEPGGEVFDAVLARPGPSVRVLSDRLRQALSGARLLEAATAARLEVLETGPLPSAQGNLFPSTRTGQAAVAAVVTRLEQRIGADRVFTPRLCTAHAPEATWEARPWGAAERRSAPKGREGVRRPRSALVEKGRALLHRLGPRALRLLSPPRPAMVRCEDGRPRELRAGKQAGRVRREAGPFPLSGAWWSEDAFDRLYHDVELESGEILRLYHDRPTGRWFLQGIYD